MGVRLDESGSTRCVDRLERRWADGHTLQGRVWQGTHEAAPAKPSRWRELRTRGALKGECSGASMAYGTTSSKTLKNRDLEIARRS